MTLKFMASKVKDVATLRNLNVRMSYHISESVSWIQWGREGEQEMQNISNLTVSKFPYSITCVRPYYKSVRVLLSLILNCFFMWLKWQEE